jgi:hypothetical protein
VRTALTRSATRQMRRAGTWSNVKPSWPSKDMAPAVYQGAGVPNGRSKMGRRERKKRNIQLTRGPSAVRLELRGALRSARKLKPHWSGFDPERSTSDVQKNSTGSHVHSRSFGGRGFCPSTADLRHSHRMRKPLHPFDHLRQAMLLLFRPERRHHRRVPARRSATGTRTITIRKENEQC